MRSSHWEPGQKDERLFVWWAILQFFSLWLKRRSNIHPSCQVLLKDNLTEDNFQRILAVIWESSAQVRIKNRSSGKKQFSCLCFSDFGGDHLPLHREQEATHLLQNPLGDPQSALRLLLWRPHSQGRDSYQVERYMHGWWICILPHPNPILERYMDGWWVCTAPKSNYMHCADNSAHRMRQLLQLYASDSADLISRYYWERIKEQRNLQVIVKCQWQLIIRSI